jgi:two-component system CheB/CheR fusion protein
LTYFAARRISREIRSLQCTTEAIATGEISTPVDVDCACEVGGLADSFQKMVDRVNANILRMNALAHKDAVTGLPNRTVINHVLALAARAEHRFEGALLFLDLDGFKLINDTLGHESGDDLLREVSRRIVEGLGRRMENVAACTNHFGELCVTPPDDIVFARFAGDEFVLLAPGLVARADAEALAERIVASLRQPFVIKSAEIEVTVSVGVARAPVDATDPRELLCLADIAMYDARTRGKGRIAIFDEAMRAQTIEKKEIENNLRHAIERDELMLHFQPKLEAGSLAVAGVEALVRWTHPTRGMPPSKFIPIAEQAGLMPALGKAVFALAFAQCRKWERDGLRLPVAINVSVAQFDDPLFVPDLLDMVARYGVDPELIEIEITETMVMTDFEAAAQRIGALREAGLSISIDDFGAGFSNLSQLARLPVNFIKLDRSLTEGVGVNRKSEAIVRATINMAHVLGHATIAEGIETIEQAAFLRRAGCDKLQGFLFARPMPAGDLEGWLAARAAADAAGAASAA